LSVTPQTLREWHRTGILSAVRTAGRQLRVPMAEIDRLLNRAPAETYADTDAARINREYPRPDFSDAEVDSFTGADEPSGSGPPQLRTLFQK